MYGYLTHILHMGEIEENDLSPLGRSAKSLHLIEGGDNIQWTKMIEDFSQYWSTTLRTTFEDQWSGYLENVNSAFSMFDGTFHRTWLRCSLYLYPFQFRV